jgi:hypothetical protein
MSQPQDLATPVDLTPVPDLTPMAPDLGAQVCIFNVDTLEDGCLFAP